MIGFFETFSVFRVIQKERHDEKRSGKMKRLIVIITIIIAAYSAMFGQK